MAGRSRETVGAVAVVAMFAVAAWWMWPEHNDGDATTTEAAATTTLPPPTTATATTAVPEWPQWCGRYVALRVANDAYDASYSAHVAAYDPEYEAALAVYDEAWAEAEAAYDAYRAMISESEEDFDATTTEVAFDDWSRALDARIAARETLDAFTSKAEAEHLSVAEAARAYVAASVVYADSYHEEYLAAAEAVRSYDALSAVLDEAQSAYDEARVAYESVQAAYDEALAAYDAGNEDAWFGRHFDARGHPYDAYRAGWDASYDAQASGNPLSDIQFDPPALARYGAAVDAANGRWADDLSSLSRAAGERGQAWMALGPAIEALNSAAVAALWAVAPEGMDWPDLVQACEG